MECALENATTAINGTGGIFPYNTTFDPTSHFDISCRYRARPCPVRGALRASSRRNHTLQRHHRHQARLYCLPPLQWSLPFRHQVQPKQVCEQVEDMHWDWRSIGVQPRSAFFAALQHAQVNDIAPSIIQLHCQILAVTVTPVNNGSTIRSRSIHFSCSSSIRREHPPFLRALLQRRP